MAPVTYTLHHNAYSICSIMVRYCIAIRGEPKEDLSEVIFNEKDVDLFTKEQLSEHFLCEVNPKGQVPTLTSPSLQEPICDSVDITHYIAGLFPSLAPEPHGEAIYRLIGELHSINFFSLTFTNTPSASTSTRDEINRRLQDDISPKYRQALEYKMKILESGKIAALAPAFVKETVDRTRSVMAAFEKHLPNGATWLFGCLVPTAVDAHLVVFISRMMDVDRAELIPKRLLTYAEDAQTTTEWQTVMQGRRTMPGRAGRAD